MTRPAFGIPGASARLVSALALACAAVGCRGSTPPTQHYTLVAPDHAGLDETSVAASARGLAAALESSAVRGSPTIVVEDFSADAAYVDLRIAYRTDPVRLAYYTYHEWAALPGVLVPDQLRELLERSGYFASVSRDPSSGADANLEGRISRFEEVDVSEDEWVAVIVLELRLEDARTNATLETWTSRARVPVKEQSPSGVAWALSRGLADIAERLAPELASLASKPRSTRADSSQRDP